MENEIDNGGKADVSGEPVVASNFYSSFRTYAVPWVGGNGVCHGGNDFLPRFISLATKRTVRLFKKLRKAIRHYIYGCCLVFWRYGGLAMLDRDRSRRLFIPARDTVSCKFRSFAFRSISSRN